MSFDWRKLISGVAPTLATALGGPFAGAAVAAISSAVLGKPDGSEDELNAALAIANPDLLAKIKESDNTFKTRMEELGVDLEKARYQDIQSARNMNIMKSDNTARNLAYIIVSGFFLVLFIQIVVAVHPTWAISADVQRTLDISFGILFTAFTGVISFYFGSSQGAIASNKSLRRIAEGQGGTVN